MKNVAITSLKMRLAIICLLASPLLGISQNEMQGGEHNFTSFKPAVQADPVELAKFSSATSHPEYGTLPFNAPCEDCIEVIEERTAYTRKFLRNGRDGKEVLTQKGYSPLHYQNQSGQWITYNPKLKAYNNKVGTSNDYYKIEINLQEGFIFFQNYHQHFEPLIFHKDLKLEKLDENGNVISILAANWSNYTAGEEGVRVIDLFPNVDLNILVYREIIKTSFTVKQDIGKFRIKESLEQSILDRVSQQTTEHEVISLYESGELSYEIGEILIDGVDGEKRKLVHGYYTIDGNELVYNWDEAEFAALNYPVVIDPTVTSTGTLPQGSITGAGTFANVGAFTTGCMYNLAVPTPANCQITDIQWSFTYSAQLGGVLADGAVKFYYGACVSPGTAGFYWFCNNATAGGTCAGTNVSIFSDFQTCIPAPQCAAYNMNFTMEFFDTWGAFNTFNCDPTYISAATGWTMTIIGETVAQPSVPTSSSGNTICEGSSTNLTATANFGVPPYNYSWNNGGGTGNPVSVSPTSTTTYTCTITDACGQTATNNITINVVPAPDAGTNSSVNFCPTDPITSLLGVLGGTPDATGSWTGPSTLGGGSAGNFNPATMNAGVYTYTVTGAAPCTNASATVTVTFNTAANAGTNGAVSFCPSDPSSDLFNQLGGSPQAGGTWSPALTSGTGVFNPAVDAGGTYTYTVTNSCGSASANVIVTINPAPIAGTNGSVSFCNSDPSSDLFNQLGGSPQAGGTWSPALTSGTGVFNPAIDAGGTYTYTITNVCGSASANVTVTVTSGPNAGTNGAVSFCPSDPSSDLFNQLGGGPQAGGSWSPVLTSGTGVFNPAVDPAGTYTYTITSGCGSASANVVVTINPAPVAGTNGAVAFCPSDPSSDLFNQLGGSPNSGGNWSPALTSGTGVFNPAVDAAGTYTYTLTNSCGSASADVVVTINTLPNPGTNGTVSFCPSDAPADLFNSLNGTPLAGGSWAPALTSGTGVFNPAVDAAGTYTYTVTNGCGSASADVTVTLNPAPNAGTNGSLTICSSDPASDLFNQLGGSPDAGGTWSPALSSGTGVFDPLLDAAGTYTYTATNGCGSISADVVVTIVGTPNAGTNGAVSFCPSDPTSDLFNQLGGTPDPGGTWSPALTSGTGVFTPGVDPAGTYTYTVNASCGTATADVVVTMNPAPNAGNPGSISFCPADPSSDLFSVLGGSPDAGGIWSPALASGTGVFNPGADAAGIYTYTVTNGCGSDAADITVTITANPNPGTNGTITLCSTDSPTNLFNSLGGTPDAGGTWSPALTSGTGVLNPAVDAAGTYTYTLNACGGGTLTATVTVTINPAPNAGTDGSVTLCNNDPSTDLFTSLGGTPGTGGSWSPAMSSGSGVFNPSVDAAGVYTYTITNSCGSSTATVTVTVNGCSPPTADFSVSDTAICAGDCIILTDLSTDNPVSIEWDFGGAVSPNTSTDPNPTICPLTPGTYTITLTATNTNGSTTASTIISVEGNPLVTAFGDTIITLSGAAQLGVIVNPTGGTFSWTDGDDDGTIDCPTCPDITVEPTLTTDYIITYSTANGCAATDTATVYVNIVDMVDVPNGFSPNGDGENDILFVKGLGIKNMHFAIYNRYGQLLFETDDQSIGWDGTYLGSPENPGVFAWYLEYTLVDGRSSFKKGNVTLIK